MDQTPLFAQSTNLEDLVLKNLDLREGILEKIQNY